MKRFIVIALILLFAGCGLRQDNLQDLMELAEKTSANTKVSAMDDPSGGVDINRNFQHAYPYNKDKTRAPHTEVGSHKFQDPWQSPQG